MRALVTGANGFLGTKVVAALIARGHQVTACVRPSAAIGELTALGVIDVFRADLRTTSDLDSAFKDIDVLVHLAASVTGGEDAQFASTVTGTERLLDAMARSRCRRLVLASSFSVYDWSKITGTLDESSPIEAGDDLYGRDGYSIAKSWQERVARRFAEQHQWDLTVLRPGFIWGRDKAYLAALGQQIGSKLHVVIGPFTRIPMTHVDNCADLFALATVDPRAIGQTFNVVDDGGQRVWSFLGDYLKGMKETGFRVPVPYSLTYFGVDLLYRRLFNRNNKLPQILIPCRLESRLKPLTYTNRRAADVLGWHPPVSYAECLRRTFEPSSAI